MNKKLILLLLSTFLIISCATTTSTSMPNWFVNQYDATYNKNGYIVAVGSGDTLEEANENAKISLSQTFNTSIKNAMQTYQNDTVSSFSSRGYIDTSVDDLIGVKVVNTFQNGDGTYFVRVALDKQISRDKTREIITPKNSEISSLMNKGNKNNFEYLNDLLRAQKVALGIQKYYDQLSVLENSNVVSPLMNIENNIADLKALLKLQIKVNSDDKDVSDQLKKVVETMLVEGGVSVESSPSLLIVDYNEGSISKNGDLYHLGFNLQVQLIDDNLVVFSVNKDSKGVGISEETARTKAMDKAVNIIEEELF